MLLAVVCIGCKVESYKEAGYDYSRWVCKKCTKIIENVSKKYYSYFRLIGDTESGLDFDAITKTDLIKEFEAFLREKGYKI